MSLYLNSAIREFERVSSPVMKSHRFPEVSSHISRIDNAIEAGHASSQLVVRIGLEIEELEAACLQLRASRNACQPLLRLPSEILGELAESLMVVWPAHNGFSTLGRIGRQPEEQDQRLRLGWVPRRARLSQAQESRTFTS